MLERIANLVQSTADVLFVPVLVIVLFGTGLFLTIRLRAVQIRRFGDAIRAFLSGSSTSTSGALSPFQAFMTALGATIGTGNIAGVAAGVVSGGPGVLFWIWCYGFFATAIKFSEAVPQHLLGRMLAVRDVDAPGVVAVCTEPVDVVSSQPS